MTLVEIQDVESVVATEILPALGVHGGSIEVEEVRDGRVRLRLLASCNSCYFRKGCVVNLIIPTLREFVDDQLQVEVRGVRIPERHAIGTGAGSHQEE